ncbi:MAG: hypothetical protein ISR84_00810 [Kiritimatiellales bacterium]|nr:hypothetical protein [Kiritimatiellales bacterium]
MNKLTEMIYALKYDTLQVPIWEVFTLLAITTICLIIRGSKAGLLITYMFTLHIAFSFLRMHFSTVELFVLGIFGTIILLIGLYEALTDR